MVESRCEPAPGRASTVSTPGQRCFPVAPVEQATHGARDDSRVGCPPGVWGILLTFPCHALRRARAQDAPGGGCGGSGSPLSAIPFFTHALARHRGTTTVGRASGLSDGAVLAGRHTSAVGRRRRDFAASQARSAVQPVVSNGCKRRTSRSLRSLRSAGIERSVAAQGARPRCSPPRPSDSRRPRYTAGTATARARGAPHSTGRVRRRSET
jgi:hypothetical protein